MATSCHYFYITPEEYAIAEQNGISARLVTERVRRLAWSVDRAITTPPKIHKDRKKWLEIAKQNGISIITFYSRVRKGGMDPEKAATTPIMPMRENIQKMVDARWKPEDAVTKSSHY